MLEAFQQFFREHSDAWLDGFSFKEAGPQLLLQAFLQRIVNGGGHINREYGLGRKRWITRKISAHKKEAHAGWTIGVWGA